MKRELLNYLVCPKTYSKLTLEQETVNDKGEILDGVLVNNDNYKYPIVEGLPDMAFEKELIGDAKFARSYYTGISDSYDQDVEITFHLYKEEERAVREFMINLLNLKDSNKVLEISAGTGKDSELISKKIGKDGSLTLLDITPSMLQKAKENLKDSPISIEFVVGTACALPFSDDSFDALYCFAGVGHFPDIKKALKEMTRVVRVGGRVVFCEKNVPVWLRNTEYGRILINNNPMFEYDAPLAHIPVEARNLGIRWILGNVHYVVDFTVGDGEPCGNFDLELPGARGGSFNTRYFGKLEGVTPETKSLALKARSKMGVSMHKWLDEVVKKEAKKVLGEIDELD